MGRKPRVDPSPEEKGQIAQEGIKSGDPSETCRRHGVAPHLFYRWKDEAEQGAKAALGERSAAAPETEKDRRIRQLEQLVLEQTAQLSRAREQLEQSYDDALEALGCALELRQAETRGHCQRVTAFTISIAKTVPVSVSYLPILARAAFLHDIGKMAIPDSVLYKPGPLNDGEKQIMRTHCQIGYNVLRRIPFLRDAAEIVLSQHEFFDGSGYPSGLKGEAIPLGARILAVAEALDTMISEQPDRRPLKLFDAREEIRRCSGAQFDPKVVEVFFSMPESLWVELSKSLGATFRL